MPNEPTANAGLNWNRTGILFYSLIAVYAVARVLQIFPDKIPMIAIVALHVLPPLVFALIHGAISYRWRGILAFFVVSLLIGNIIENIGVATGFPFGRYYFTHLMGPKLFNVPIFLGLAYLGMGYLSWTLARVILGGMYKPLAGNRIILLPLIASFIMVAWDFSMDPVWATVMHAWIWLQGGAYYGVPVTNFLGWFLDVFLIYLAFALYLCRRPTNPQPLPPGYWSSAVLFYAISASGNLLLAIPTAVPSVTIDPVGVQWKVSSIVGACALVSIFCMGGFALIAWDRIEEDSTNPRDRFRL